MTAFRRDLRHLRITTVVSWFFFVIPFPRGDLFKGSVVASLSPSDHSVGGHGRDAWPPVQGLRSAMSSRGVCSSEALGILWTFILGRTIGDWPRSHPS